MIWHDFIFVQFFYISKTCTGVCRIFIYTTHNPKAKLWCALLRISPRLKLLQVKSVLATFARLSYQKNSSFPSIQTVLKVKHIHSALVRKKRKQSSMFLFHKSSYSPEFRLRNIAMIMLVEFEESTRGATAWMDHKFTSITYGLWFRRGCFHDSIGLYMHILKNVQCSKIRKLHQNQYQVNWAAVLKPFIPGPQAWKSHTAVHSSCLLLDPILVAFFSVVSNARSTDSLQSQWIRYQVKALLH